MKVAATLIIGGWLVFGLCLFGRRAAAAVDAAIDRFFDWGRP